MDFLDPNRQLREGLLEGGLDLPSIIDSYFNAYNAARLREACQLLVRLLNADATVGVTLSGALTPAGLGHVLVPLIRAGEDARSSVEK